MEYNEELLNERVEWLNGLDMLPKNYKFKNDYAYDGVRLVVRNEHGGETDMSKRFFEEDEHDYENYAEMLNTIYNVMAKIKREQK